MHEIKIVAIKWLCIQPKKEGKIRIQKFSFICFFGQKNKFYQNGIKDNNWGKIISLWKLKQSQTKGGNKINITYPSSYKSTSYRVRHYNSHQPNTVGKQVQEMQNFPNIYHFSPIKDSRKLQKRACWRLPHCSIINF